MLGVDCNNFKIVDKVDDSVIDGDEVLLEMKGITMLLQRGMADSLVN